MSQTLTPPRLRAAKAAAMSTAIVATSAALIIGLTAPAPQTFLPDQQIARAGVDLVATTAALEGGPDAVGLHGVGPIFWAADLLGITPEGIVLTAVGLAGSPELTQAVQTLLQILKAVSPIDHGAKGPPPGDVFDAVNGLTYSGDAFIELLGPLPELPLVADILDTLIAQAPILNQRRAAIFAESLGGLSTTLAYRDMITAVQSNDPAWGEGVTGVWLVMINNISRPGGGIFALATPLTDRLFGLNLSTPAGGSHTNEDANGGDITKVLNASVLDITWAYNLLSDAPTTLNPLAWANAAAGSIFITYLIPDELDVSTTNLTSHVLPQLLLGGLNGLGVTADPAGGQGSDMIPVLGPILDLLEMNIPGLVGTSTYITYDSGNLALLEPLRILPRLASLIPGVYLPTPLTSTVEEALQILVNTGYQDLNPMAWTLTLPGLHLAPIVQNPASATIAAALRDALEEFRDTANPLFDDVEDALTPFTSALDDLDARVTAAIDEAVGVSPTPAPSAITALPDVHTTRLFEIPTTSGTPTKHPTANVNDQPVKTAASPEAPPTDIEKQLDDADPAESTTSPTIPEADQDRESLADNTKAIRDNARAAREHITATTKQARDRIAESATTAHDATDTSTKRAQDRLRPRHYRRGHRRLAFARCRGGK